MLSFIKINSIFLLIIRKVKKINQHFFSTVEFGESNPDEWWLGLNWKHLSRKICSKKIELVHFSPLKLLIVKIFLKDFFKNFFFLKAQMSRRKIYLNIKRKPHQETSSFLIVSCSKTFHFQKFSEHFLSKRKSTS